MVKWQTFPIAEYTVSILHSDFLYLHKGGSGLHSLTQTEVSLTQTEVSCLSVMALLK